MFSFLISFIFSFLDGFTRTLPLKKKTEEEKKVRVSEFVFECATTDSIGHIVISGVMMVLLTTSAPISEEFGIEAGIFRRWGVSATGRFVPFWGYAALVSPPR